MDKRKQQRNNKAAIAKKDTNALEEDSDGIKDDYSGFGEDMFKKAAPKKNKILNDDFLMELKVAKVADSDDEEYF